MKHKIIKVGHFPTTTIHKKSIEQAKSETKITPQFKAWLDEFIEENSELLLKLTRI